MRVLIADDEPEDIDLLVRAIRLHYRRAVIEVRTDVGAALDLLSTQRFDLVVTDYVFKYDTRDGATVANHALAHQPEALVLLTSGDELPAPVIAAFAAHALGTPRRVYFTIKHRLVNSLDLVVELVARRQAAHGRGILFVAHPIAADRDALHAFGRWLASCVQLAQRPWEVKMIYLQPTRDAFEEIEDALRGCDALVADLRDMRPSVFAEIGFAQALGKPILLLSPHEEVPYNVSMHKLVRYDRDPTNDPRVTGEVVAFLRSLPARFVG